MSNLENNSYVKHSDNDICLIACYKNKEYQDISLKNTLKSCQSLISDN